MEERAPYARRDALISQIQGQSRVGAGGSEAGDSLRKAPILGSAASRAVTNGAPILYPNLSTTIISLYHSANYRATEPLGELVKARKRDGLDSQRL